MAHPAHESHTFGRDTKAAFAGLILGAVALFAVVRVIVSLTNAKFASHKAAAESTH